jgi:predicted acetyltransferase
MRFVVAQVGPDLVGRISIHHELNEYLAHYPGHIGYGVARVTGIAGKPTEIFRQVLVLLAPKESTG